MIHTVETVKEEIRVLGLDTCRKGEVFGAVVRGGKYLDGVVHFEFSKGGDGELCERIRGTKYFPELRILMLHDPRKQLLPDLLEQITGLPVIRVSERANAGPLVFRSKLGAVAQQSHLTKQIANKILSVTWTSGNLPEPARIAHLLAGRHLQV